MQVIDFLAINQKIGAIRVKMVIFVAGYAGRYRGIEPIRIVLNAVARPIGPSTWESRVSEKQLDSIRIALSRILPSRKASVVAYQVEGFSRKRIHALWVVGRNPLSEHGWIHSVRRISRKPRGHSIAGSPDLAALLKLAGRWHDVGKNTAHFQEKLKTQRIIADAVRHEVISVERLTGLPLSQWRSPRLGDGRLSDDDQGMDWLSWLVLSHHRLPGVDEYDGKVDLNLQGHVVQNTDAAPKNHAADQSLQKWALLSDALTPETGKRQAIPSVGAWVFSRLALMMADHYVSSIQPEMSDSEPSALTAQLRRKLAIGNQPIANPNQDLKGHLEAVGSMARILLPRLINARWAIGLAGTSCLPLLNGVSGASGRYGWQRDAIETASRYAQQISPGFGGLILVGSSTGSGKTRTCAAIGAALKNPDLENDENKTPVRMTVAMGLRTLTLQTHRAYVDEIGLPESEVALVMGGSGYSSQNQAALDEQDGDEEWVIHDTGLSPDAISLIAPVGAQFKDRKNQRFLHTPVVVCTVDQIIRMADHSRSQWIKPWLRLMSTDVLILDEVDGLDSKDLPALIRMIYFCSLLGVHLVISSATLYPAIIRSIRYAYEKGLVDRCLFLGVDPPQKPAIALIGDAPESCRVTHDFEVDYLQYRSALTANAVPRQGQVIGQGAETPEAMRASILDQVMCFHAIHAETSHAGPKVSIGMIRLSHVEQVIQMARAFLDHAKQHDQPDQPLLRGVVYHSRNTLVARAEIEKRLDRMLKRNRDSQPESQPDIASAIQQAQSENRDLCIVVITTMEEAGQDHDYDWAIIEPASARSIVQISGRVYRHRDLSRADPERIAVLDRNFRSLKNEKRVFCQPGFEQGTPYPKQTISALIDHHFSIDASLCLTPRKDHLGDLDNRSIEDFLDRSAQPFLEKDIQKITGNHYKKHGFRVQYWKDDQLEWNPKNKRWDRVNSKGHREELTLIPVRLLGEYSLFKDDPPYLQSNSSGKEKIIIQAPNRKITGIDPWFGLVYD